MGKKLRTPLNRQIERRRHLKEEKGDLGLLLDLHEVLWVANKGVKVRTATSAVARPLALSNKMDQYNTKERERNE